MIISPFVFTCYRKWKAELSKAESSKSITQKSYTPSLAMAIIRTFGPFYAFLGIFTFIEECIFRIFQPLFMCKSRGLISIMCFCYCLLFLAWMIDYFTPGSTTTLEEAYMYGTGVVMMSAAYTFTHHAYFFEVMNTGMKIRIASCSLLYRKVVLMLFF